jgi:hypothetical protein
MATAAAFEHTIMPELVQFRAPRGFSKALDTVAEKTFEPRAAVIRRALLRLLAEHNVEVSK